MTERSPNKASKLNLEGDTREFATNSMAADDRRHDDSGSDGGVYPVGWRDPKRDSDRSERFHVHADAADPQGRRHGHERELFPQVRQAGHVSFYVLDSSAHGRNDRRSVIL